MKKIQKFKPIAVQHELSLFIMEAGQFTDHFEIVEK